MGTRDDTMYHIARRLIEEFYGAWETVDFCPIPPINEEKRRLVEKNLKPLIDRIRDNPALIEKRSGTLNYVLCRLLNAFYPKEQARYGDMNNAVGVLETALQESQIGQSVRYEARGMVRCAIEEYYRRRLSPYEDTARDENGEVFE